MPKVLRIATLLACAAVSVALPLRAAPTSRPIDLFNLGAPSFTTFSTRDGVPYWVTTSIQTDADGFVWLGSQHGLARYDGKRWEMLDNPALDAYVDNLLLDHTGTLWASSRTFGLARYNGAHWHRIGKASGMTTRHVRRLVETTDANGRVRLWAATWDAGVFAYDNGRWSHYVGTPQLPRSPVLSLAQTLTIGGHKRFWVGTGSQGLWYRQQGRWQRFQPPGFNGGQIECLYATRHAGHEALWISLFGSGLWRLDANGLRSWTREGGQLASDEVYDIAQTRLPNGNYATWVASRSGLVRIYHDRAQVFDRRHGLPSNAIRGLSAWRSPDGVEVLWLATESGVARTIAGANQWKTASLMGAGQIGVFGVRVEPDGKGGERLWVGSTGDGLGLFDDGTWRYFTKANGSLPDNDVRMIVRADDEHGDSALWISQRFGYLLRMRGDLRFRRVTAPWPRDKDQVVLDMLSRRIDGRVEQWFATRQSGIYRRRDGAWKAYRPAGVVDQWSVDKLAAQVDAHGRSWLWASSNQGLARFDGHAWSLLGHDAGLPGTDLRGMSLLNDATGRPVLWIGSTHNGIIRVDVGDPMQPRVLPADLPPPPNTTTYGAVRDSAGRIYICTNAGVQRLTPTANGYTSQVFTRRNGMVHDECNTNAQQVDAHDRFWTGTLGGLTVYDPNREIFDRQAKPLKLTRVELDGKPVSTRPLIVPPGRHDLRVEFALLSWRRESESRFRTQLTGYQSEPGDWTAQNFRDYGSLPPGDYELRIEARDYAGNPSTPIRLGISVVPAWWQRGWAMILFALTVLLAVYALLHWRTRSLYVQRRRLEEQVAHRTAELNEANARLRDLSYTDALTGLANRRRLLETLEPEFGNTDLETSTALIFVDVDHFKDYNDRFGHPAGDAALRCVADAMRSCAPDAALVARYGGEEFACLLPGFDLIRARTLAERIRVAVESSVVPVPGTSHTNRVTISAGVASLALANAADAHRLLRDADGALYQAKRAGRNCVRG